MSNVLLSRADLGELEFFRQYLGDCQSLSQLEVYRKYQNYLCISDDELASYEAEARLEAKS